jgi:hypothetical protein
MEDETAVEEAMALSLPLLWRPFLRLLRSCRSLVPSFRGILPRLLHRQRHSERERRWRWNWSALSSPIYDHNLCLASHSTYSLFCLAFAKWNWSPKSWSKQQERAQQNHRQNSSQDQECPQVYRFVRRCASVGSSICCSWRNFSQSKEEHYDYMCSMLQIIISGRADRTRPSSALDSDVCWCHRSQRFPRPKEAH